MLFLKYVNIIYGTQKSRFVSLMSPVGEVSKVDET